ncbi:MAG: SseB family protein [Alphaproteobacteria bacterium]|nr:SseB family protein [Alphaproteobacteria bacterium]
MQDMTPLDQAHDEMAQDTDNDSARLRFYQRLVEVELFVLLESEPEGPTINPQVFPVEDSAYMLVFDSEARLAEFAQGTAPFAAMSGRKIVEMLGADGPAQLGLGVNLTVAPSSILIPANGVDWLTGMLDQDLVETVQMVQNFQAPRDLAADFIAAIDRKLATATGLAKQAYLLGLQFQDGTAGNMLAFVGAIPEAEGALQQAIGDVVRFADLAGRFDVGFFALDAPEIASFERVGLRFDLPQMDARREDVPGKGPGMDPDVPPILR